MSVNETGAMDAMPVTALLATASGLQGPLGLDGAPDPGPAHRLADQHRLGLDGAGHSPAAAAGPGRAAAPAVGLSTLDGGPRSGLHPAVLSVRLVRLAVASRPRRPQGGQGIRLETSDGRSRELAELLDGFGVLCDALLLRVPAGLRVDPDASLLMLRAASLEPEALQLA